MENVENKNCGKLALGLCLGGLIIFTCFVSATILFKLPSPSSIAAAGYFVFIGLQISAFVLGILSKNDKFGKAAYITSSILALGSLALM